MKIIAEITHREVSTNPGREATAHQPTEPRHRHPDTHIKLGLLLAAGLPVDGLEVESLDARLRAERDAARQPWMAEHAVAA